MREISTTLAIEKDPFQTQNDSTSTLELPIRAARGFLEVFQVTYELDPEYATRFDLIDMDYPKFTLPEFSVHDDTNSSDDSQPIAIPSSNWRLNDEIDEDSPDGIIFGLALYLDPETEENSQAHALLLDKIAQANNISKLPDADDSDMTLGLFIPLDLTGSTITSPASTLRADLDIE